MQPLKLVALDTEDLAVISAQLQDAVMRLADMAWTPREKRFVIVLNRFDWPTAFAAVGGKEPGNERRRSAIRFEHVRKVLRQNISQAEPDAVLALLAIRFEPAAEAPAGSITLLFAGGAAIRLEVDYIEAEMRDLGGAWAAAMRPDHGGDEPQAG